MARYETTKRMMQVVAGAYVNKPQVNLQQSDRICAGFYATVFSIPIDKEFSFAEYNDAVSDLTDGNFTIEANSLYNVGPKVFRCILASTVESVPYSDDALTDMKLHAVRANVFMDNENDVIWRLEGEGDNKRLIQDSKQDFGALLEAKRSRTPIIASDDVYVPYEENDYAHFFNHQTLSMDFGYVVSRDNKDYVFSRSTSSLVPIVTAAQVVIADQPDTMKNPGRQKNNMIIASEYSIDSYLDFLRKMYGADNPYYKAWEQAVRAHAVR